MISPTVFCFWVIIFIFCSGQVIFAESQEKKIVDEEKGFFIKQSFQTERQWKSSDGKFSTIARLVGIIDGSVVLKKAENNGKLIEISREKLSQVDLLFLQNIELNYKKIQTKSSAQSVQKTEYSILKDETLHKIKRSVDVRLNNPVNEKELEEIALKIKAINPNKFERTFIGYYLPDMKVNAGYWATTHFDPTLEVRIIGLSKEQLNEIKLKYLDKTVNKNDSQIIGTWHHSILKYVFIIEKRQIDYTATVIFDDGSQSSCKLQYRKKGTTEEFMTIGKLLGSVHYFRITPQGSLEEFDNEGVIFVMPKM